MRRIAGTRPETTSIARVARRESVKPALFGGGVMSRVSAPEQKARPLPVSTTVQASLSCATSAKASCSGATSSKAIEFMRSGRSITITLVCGRGFSIRTVLKRSSASDRVEGPREVGEQVLGVLDAAGEADQRVGDPHLDAVRALDVPVGHQHGHLDQRLDAAEARGDVR